MIRTSDTFEFAKKAPATIFIDQLDALDTKWFNPENRDRKVLRRVHQGHVHSHRIIRTGEVDFGDLVLSTDELNEAQLKLLGYTTYFRAICQWTIRHSGKL